MIVLFTVLILGGLLSYTSLNYELLPKFSAAVTQGKARAVDLAMLEDRIAINEGKKQRYGTQIISGPNGLPCVAPIEDPEHLDELRKSVGLPTMQEYLQHVEAELGRSIDKSALNDR